MAFKSRVGDILIKAKVIDDMQLRSAMAQHDQWGGRLGKVIADMGLADEDTIADAISKATGFPRIQVGHITRDAAAIAKLDVTYVEQRMIFPVQLKDNGKTLVLAMADPTDLEVMDQVSTRARARVIPMVAGESEIHNAILRYYRNMDPRAIEAPRARKAVRRAEQEEAEGGDEEEFKITDMSGKTVMKRLSDIAPPASFADVPAMEGISSASQKASDILDEILTGPANQLTPEEMARLESVQINQEKSAKILRALVELLSEKGYLSPRDLQTRIKT
jgi:hypothetical protein